MHSYKPYAYIERQRQRLPAMKNLNTIHKLNIPPSIITNVTVLLPMLTKRRGQSLRCDVTIHTIGREGEHSPFYPSNVHGTKRLSVCVHSTVFPLKVLGPSIPFISSYPQCVRMRNPVSRPFLFVSIFHTLPITLPRLLTASSSSCRAPSSSASPPLFHSNQQSISICQITRLRAYILCTSLISCFCFL